MSLALFFTPKPAACLPRRLPGRSPGPASAWGAGLTAGRAAGRAAGPAAALLLALAGCASPAPPIRLYTLPLAPPAGSAAATAAATAPAAAAPGDTWQLAPLRLPAYLDRDALLLPGADPTRLQPLDGHRWAEPLRDALPRLLQEDLRTLRGAARVWAAPLPAGLVIHRQLTVELLALDVTPDRAGVHLQARWTLADPTGATAPQVGQADLRAAATGPEPGQLVAAHRLALWQLAERVAASPPAR